MKIQKKYAIGAAIGLVSVTGFILYTQIMKVLNYRLDFKGFKNVSANKNGLSFIIVYEYENKAKIDITLAEQKYEIFIDGVYVTTLTNFAPNTLIGSKPSTIELNVNLTIDELKKAKVNWSKMILQPGQVQVDTIMRWKVKFGFLRIPYKYTYRVSLKEIIGWYAPIINKF
jgi:LEA14-like dessication related protein